MDIIISEEEFQRMADEVEAEYQEYRAMLESSGIMDLE